MRLLCDNAPTQIHLRSGWVDCGVPTERIESVAEHIYSSQMLALVINAEFDLKLDMGKVALLLAIHELGECIIGDLPATGCPVSKDEKHKMEMKAVEQILKPLLNAGAIKDLLLCCAPQLLRAARTAFLF